MLLPPLNRLSWRRLVLIILEEISPERRDDSRRKKERKKEKCRFVHLPGIELETLETWWISTAERPRLVLTSGPYRVDPNRRNCNFLTPGRFQGAEWCEIRNWTPTLFPPSFLV